MHNTPCNTAQQSIQSIEVYIVTRSPVILAPNTLVTLCLDDISLADAPSRPIAQTRLLVGGPLPICLVLNYDAARLNPRRDYALNVLIEQDRRLLYTNTSVHALAPQPAVERTSIIVDRVTTLPLFEGLDPAQLKPEGIHGGNLIEQQAPGLHGGNLLDQATQGIHGDNSKD